MARMDSGQIKRMAAELGADLCGVGAADRFGEAPEGFHPRDVPPGCRSVIALARRFNPSTHNARSTSPYTVTRNALSAAMDRLARELAGAMDALGCRAVPIGSIGPDEYDARADRFRGTISLKHAAVLCVPPKITCIPNPKSHF